MQKIMIGTKTASMTKLAQTMSRRRSLSRPIEAPTSSFLVSYCQREKRAVGGSVSVRGDGFLKGERILKMEGFSR